MTWTPSTPPAPRFTLPRLKLPAVAWPFAWTGVRRIGAVLATVALVAAFIGTFQLLRGHDGQTTQVASGPAATVTTLVTVTAGPTATPPPTPTAIPLHPNVVVTQNQDMRPACTDPSNAYTVVLANNGDVAANWQVDIPAVVVLRPPIGPTAPLSSPRSASPYWAQAQPADGSVAPGQTASFVMAPDWAIPCGGTTYHAAVKLSFPSGASEPDIPLTYAGIGPAPYSQIDLVAGAADMPQTCPAAGATPKSFVVAFKNSGNATAQPKIDVYQENVGANFGWATWQVVQDPPNEPVSLWLYAGETWTATIQPYAGVVCSGTMTYHVYLHFMLAQGTSQMITINVTFS